MTRPVPQHLEHHDPAEKLGLMINRLEEDVVMLDDWEPEGEDENEDEKQLSGVHGERILKHSFQSCYAIPATHLIGVCLM